MGLVARRRLFWVGYAGWSVLPAWLLVGSWLPGWPPQAIGWRVGLVCGAMLVPWLVSVWRRRLAIGVAVGLLAGLLVLVGGVLLKLLWDVRQRGWDLGDPEVSPMATLGLAAVLVYAVIIPAGGLLLWGWGATPGVTRAVGRLLRGVGPA